MMPADDAAFAALTGKISREAGLSLDAYKDKCLRRRIAVRMRAASTPFRITKRFSIAVRQSTSV